MQSHYYGSLEYNEGLALQERAFIQARTQQANGRIIGLEHPSVVTLGRRSHGNHALELKSDRGQLRDDFGIDLVEVGRGGHATLHSPGQLVIYPVISLAHFELGVREYVDLLTSVTQACLAEFGVQANPRTGEPGLYTHFGKIAFFGVQIRHGISTHGLSINISNDLSLFGHIRSCGITSESFDSIEQYLQRQSARVSIPALNHTSIGDPLRDPAAVFQSWYKIFESRLVARN